MMCVSRDGEHAQKNLDLPPKGARLGSEFHVVVVSSRSLGCVRDGYDQPVLLKIPKNAVRDSLLRGVDAQLVLDLVAAKPRVSLHDFVDLVTQPMIAHLSIEWLLIGPVATVG